MKWILILITVFASSSGDVLCASGMSEGEGMEDHGPSILMRSLRYIVTRRKVILGIVCYASAFFSMVGLLAVVPLSVAVPATALSFVMDTIGARFILHERVPLRRWLGVACVCAGVILAVQPALVAGPAGDGVTTMQTHKDQSRSHQAGAQGLDDQGASAKVLAKP